MYQIKYCQDRLYYYETAVDNSILGLIDNSNTKIALYTFLSTVEYNKSYFRSNETEVENNARKLQHIIGWPSTANSKFIIK